MYTTYLESIENLTGAVKGKHLHLDNQESIEHFLILKQICFEWLKKLEPSLAAKEHIITSFYHRQLKGIQINRHKSGKIAFSPICLESLYEQMLMLAMCHRDELSPYLEE